MIRYPVFNSVKEVDDFINRFENNPDQSWRDEEIQWTWSLDGSPVYTTAGQIYDDIFKPYATAQRLLLINE